MTKQTEFNVQDSLKKLKKSLEEIEPAVEAEINQAIQNTAYAAYASIVAKAQAELHSTRQDYLAGLKIEDLGDNTFLISLDGDFANKLEDGFPSFDMTPKLLASDKVVGVGRRSGQPWVQQSKPRGPNKETHRFANVPFERKPYAKTEGAATMADAIKNMLGRNIGGQLQPMMKTFTDPTGNPLSGKVAVAHKDSVTDPRLSGLVKYQKIYKSESGKQTVQSIYVNYRTLSENGKPWIHPGYEGLKAFEDAEKEIAENIDKIIARLL